MPRASPSLWFSRSLVEAKRQRYVIPHITIDVFIFMAPTDPQNSCYQSAGVNLTSTHVKVFYCIFRIIPSAIKRCFVSLTLASVLYLITCAVFWLNVVCWNG
jgi:hypothetical protein